MKSMKFVFYLKFLMTSLLMVAILLLMGMSSLIDLVKLNKLECPLYLNLDL